MKNLNRTETVGKMAYEENKSASEIAKIMGVTIGTVYTFCYQYKEKHGIEKSDILRNYERAAEMFLDKGMTKKEICEEMELSLATINKYINKYKRENGLAKEKNNDEVDIEEIKKEWDRVRLILNPNAKKSEAIE